MDLSFHAKTIRDLCEKKERAIKEFGKSVAEKLRGRVADLCAAISVDDLVAGNPRQIGTKEDRVWAVTIAGDLAIVFSPNHLDLPTTASGKTNWSKVTRIKILKITELE